MVLHDDPNRRRSCRCGFIAPLLPEPVSTSFHPKRPSTLSAFAASRPAIESNFLTEQDLQRPHGSSRWVRTRFSWLLKARRFPNLPTSIRLVLASAIPKGERFDWLIEKATELGVDRFIPLLTERSAVDPRDAKLARMNRIIIESCKQSGRSRLMCVEPAIAWSSLVRSAAGGVRLIAVPDGLVPSRWPRLAGNAGLILAVGPEGGFTQEEEDEAGAAGWHPIQLATNVLRIETAAIAGSAAVMAICREHQTDERN